jgi:nucleotide-binding universal stress UspA family protein
MHCVDQAIYQNILVSVDNSEHSHYAEDVGVLLAKTGNAKLTGLHVYSGRFHRTRFKALEEHLPEKYQKGDILEYQRKIHSVLIERGLEIISYEYLKNLKESCEKNRVPFEEKLLDGKNSDVIIDQSESCDLVVMGAQGMGAVPGFSSLGSNTERVLWYVGKDVFIARKKCDFSKIFVGIDGSDYSSMALHRAVHLARMFDSKLTILSSFDPRLHPVVFKSLVSVLGDEAGKVFKFKEQEQLHTSVIDTSLEELYEEYLQKGKKIAEAEGVDVKTELLRGKPYYSLYDKTTKEEADLLIVGRLGMHAGRYETLGSNAERIARLSPTNVLVVGMKKENNLKPSEPSLSKRMHHEEEKVSWNEEAQKRLENIPSFARPMAVLAIERYAKENGIKIITPDVMKNARGRYES